MNLTDWQKRVIAERRELTERLVKLRDFLDSNGVAALPPAELRRLHRQLKIMQLYDDVLYERIEAFNA